MLWLRTWKHSKHVMFIMHCKETQFARGHRESTEPQIGLKQERTEEEKDLRMAEAISFFRLLGVQAFYISNSPRQWMRNTITSFQITFTSCAIDTHKRRTWLIYNYKKSDGFKVGQNIWMSMNRAQVVVTNLLTPAILITPKRPMHVFHIEGSSPFKCVTSHNYPTTRQ